MTEDRELILRSQRGDMSAFEELVCRYDRRVMGIAMNYTKDLDEAKDIYQEVFIRVHRALDGFQFKAKFSTWLYRVATNVCLTWQSKKKRRHFVSIEERMEENSGEAASAWPRQLSMAPRSEAEAFGSEVADRIGSALETLSPQQRIVFVLRHYEGQKLREIAEILECAEGTVKKHLFVATERMREQLRELVA